MTNQPLNLEDHLGDIIHKARQAAGVTASAAAKAANLTVAELDLFEQSGEAKRPVNFEAVGALVGLRPERLEGLARGWKPNRQNLCAWRCLRQITTVEHGNAVNCFLAWDEKTLEAMLFDTGWNAAPVFQLAEEHRLDVKHLFITHGHHDHIAGKDALLERWPTMHVHAGAHPVLPPAVGQLQVASRRVPGHAEDGVIYLVSGWPGAMPPAAMLGDTLFAGSMAKGFVSAELLRKQVREQILTLPPETLLCPGHGPVTTVAEELAHNPFF